MTKWIPIRYWDFYDVPRMFVVEVLGEVLLFDCPFDERSGEYPDEYAVYVIAVLPPDSGSWTDLPEKAEERRGRAIVSSVVFDPTRREFVED